MAHGSRVGAGASGEVRPSDLRAAADAASDALVVVVVLVVKTVEVTLAVTGCGSGCEGALLSVSVLVCVGRHR